MILYKELVREITIDGKRYRLRPSFDRVLEALDVMEDESLPEAVKQRYMTWLLVKGKVRPERCYPVLMAAIKALLTSDSPAGEEDAEKSISFSQDAEYIYAAFLQSYGIDLFEMRGKLHWHKFMALLNGLPRNTRMAEVIQIRLRPIPKATKHNAEEIAQLRKLKAAYKIKLTEKETENKYQKGLYKVATALMAMAKER